MTFLMLSEVVTWIDQGGLKLVPLNLFLLKCLDSRAWAVHTYDHSRVSRKVGGSSRPTIHTNPVERTTCTSLHVNPAMPCLACVQSTSHRSWLLWPSTRVCSCAQSCWRSSQASRRKMNTSSLSYWFQPRNVQRGIITSRCSIRMTVTFASIVSNLSLSVLKFLHFRKTCLSRWPRTPQQNCQHLSSIIAPFAYSFVINFCGSKLFANGGRRPTPFRGEVAGKSPSNWTPIWDGIEHPVNADCSQQKIRAANSSILWIS